MAYPISGDPSKLSEWQRLEDLARDMSKMAIGTLLEDEERNESLRLEVSKIVADFSKHLIDNQSLEALLALAQARRLPDAIAAMFSGARINVSENRSVLHVALRMPRSEALVVDGINVVDEVHSVLGRMANFARRISSGEFRGATGKPIRTVVNIGIGGSHLGPEMASIALSDYLNADITLKFVSNIDPLAIHDVIRSVDPESVLFIVASKSFKTLETLTNARVAKTWIEERLGAGRNTISHHFVAVSSEVALAEEFGIDPENVFGFWDFVGGRYSVDSAVGLSLMIGLGPERFSSFLEGFHEVDEHFRSTPLAKNVPVLMGLLSVWYRNFFGVQTQAVLPYSTRMKRFPAYLQQLTMESNGKSVRLDGTSIAYDSGAIFWGEPGTDGQHAFYQLIHQGTTLIPCDFIVFAEPLSETAPEQHDLLVANAFAQSQALAFGRSDEDMVDVNPELRPHKRMPGNRPTTVFLVDRLSPHTLGSLIALYEHSVFTQGVIWGIDSFDQWGVELGKELAAKLAEPISKPQSPVLDDLDSSTRFLVKKYRKIRGRPC
jgi:glucose-6-phosphate isomerase